MKLKINKQNLEKILIENPIKLVKEHPVKVLGSLALATIIATTGIGKISDYINRPNAAGGYVTISDDQRQNKINELEYDSKSLDYHDLIEDKYIYHSWNKVDKIFDNIENDNFEILHQFVGLPGYKNEDAKRIQLAIPLDNFDIKDEDYEKLNEQLLTIFSKLNIEKLTLVDVDLSKIDKKVLKKIKVKDLQLISCHNDFDYKYFDTSTISKLWIAGRNGYSEENEHYDLKEYSYAKSLTLAGKVSYKNLDKMMSLEGFSLYNDEYCFDKEDYNNMIKDLNDIYRYKLTPFSYIILESCPDSNITLPPAQQITSIL